MATETEESQSLGKKTRGAENEDLVGPKKKRTQGGCDRVKADGRGKRPAEESMHEKLVKLIEAVCRNLVANKDKVSVADLVKLVQVEKEMRPQGCERMVVEWVDSIPEEE